MQGGFLFMGDEIVTTTETTETTETSALMRLLPPSSQRKPQPKKARHQLKRAKNRRTPLLLKLTGRNRLSLKGCLLRGLKSNSSIAQLSS
jgi:hypothetical protein